MICPSCSAESDDAPDSCPSCGHTLGGSLTPTITKGTILAGRYEIQATLGRGGMGMVFKAHDRVLDETVALKVLRPDVAGSGEMARRFRSEIKLARKVRHRNVCGIHEYGEDAGLQYIAMEFIQGIDLKRLLKEQHAVPPEQCFEISIQLAKGLQAIHDVGIIHRDLKTANAMLDNQGIVRLMDFGIAKKFDTEGSIGSTAVGHIIGTPEYMSPEQARGEKIDFRSDIYAMGVVVYEIFTGNVPFHAETPIATIFKHLQDPPPLEGPTVSARLPAPIIPVLAQALAKNPADRFPNARALVEGLREARNATFPGGETTPLPGGVRTSDDDLDSTTVLPRPTMVPTPVPTVHTPAPTVVARPPAGGPAARPMPSTMAPAPPAAAPQPARPPVPREPVRPQPPAPKPVERTLLPFLLVPVVGLLVVGIALFLLRDRLFGPGPSPGPSPTPVASVSTPQPEAAEPTPRPVATVAPSPVAPTAAPPPTPQVTPRERPVLVLTTVIPSPTPVSSRPAEAAGYLQIVVRPWAEVSVDGASVGTTPLKAIKLSLGPHTVRLTHPDYKPLNRKITITAGDVERLEVDLKWEAVPK